MFASSICFFALVWAGSAATDVTSKQGSATPQSSPTTSSIPYPRGPPPKIFPSRIRDLPEDDFYCWSSYVSWSSRSQWIRYADETDKLIFTTYPFIPTVQGPYTSYLPPADTTLCDGVGRVTDRKTPTGWVTTTTESYNVTITSTWFPPTPTCTVDDYGSVCSAMWHSLTSITDRIRSAGYSTDFPLDEGGDMTTLLRPPCKSVESWISTPTPVTCTIGEDVKYKVLYWPPQVAGNFCAPANVSRPTITRSPTIPGRPNTARYGDLIMTSPTLYYILKGARMSSYAGKTRIHSSAWAKFGTVVDEITLSQDPRQTPVSSALKICTRRGGRHGWSSCTTRLEPFSLEHLLTLPVENYRKSIGGDGVIYPALYTQKYTFPQNILTDAGERQWQACESFISGPATPTYIALPTEKYSYINEPWTWDGPEETDLPDVVMTEPSVTARPGSSSGPHSPVETGL